MRNIGENKNEDGDNGDDDKAIGSTGISHSHAHITNTQAQHWGYVHPTQCGDRSVVSCRMSWNSAERKPSGNKKDATYFLKSLNFHILFSTVVTTRQIVHHACVGVCGCVCLCVCVSDRARASGVVHVMRAAFSYM